MCEIDEQATMPWDDGALEKSRSLKFDVFKRDEFTCQRCGAQAPSVTLVAHMFGDDPSSANSFVTMCTTCADTKLPNEKVAHAEQMDMLDEWQTQLTKDMLDASAIVSKIMLMMTGRKLNERGKSGMARLIRKFGLSTVCDAMRTAFSQYPIDTDEDIDFAYGKIGGICYCMTHKTCRECAHYKGSRPGKHEYRHKCDLRVDDDGNYICYRSISDAEECKGFEER